MQRGRDKAGHADGGQRTSGRECDRSGPGCRHDDHAPSAAAAAPGRCLLRTRQNRTLSSSRVRQVQAALRQLEELGDQALVEVPRKANGRDRDYGAFLLMKETGRGNVPTPDYYTPGPALVRRGGR